MGQKVNPIGLRITINRTWDSCWFADKTYKDLLLKDVLIREYLFKRLSQAAVSRIVIERPAKRAVVTIYSGRPAVIIGRSGKDIEKLKQDLNKKFSEEISLNISEIRRPELDAKLVSDSIAQQLERRVSYRRAMKRAMQAAMKAGAAGIRVNCSGRLGGAEIARMEWAREGQVPLHTLRARVEYGGSVAKTTYGTCGIKVWIYRTDDKPERQRMHSK